MVRVYVVDLGRFLDCCIFYCVFFYSGLLCFDFMRSFFSFSYCFLLITVVCVCLPFLLVFAVVFCLCGINNKDIYWKPWDSTHYTEGD